MALQGIYRVPASKIKVAGVVEAIRAAQETGYSSLDLSKEYAITLASTLKTRLIQLPEPLLSYNLYDQFVDVGKHPVIKVKVMLIEIFVVPILYCGLSTIKLCGFIINRHKALLNTEKANLMIT
ncbi:hypothetical protein ACTXT7_011080 [Hymenolepis weldensis]